jgi:hypothetical protein
MKRQVIVLVFLAVGFLAANLGCRKPNASPVGPSPTPVVETVATTEQVDVFCGKCHAYPPAESFPRWAWKEEVERGYFFFGKSSLNLRPPPIDDVVRYYEQRAPEALPPARIERSATPLNVALTPKRMPDPAGGMPPAISHVSLVHLSSPERLDVVACEMRHGWVMALSPQDPNASWRILGRLKNPAHAEVLDFDGDGILDVVVADLGSFPPTDRLCGSVVWLRGQEDGTFQPITLLENVGRVADAQAVDLNGNGKLDLIVAVFGWQENGGILVLENVTTDWSRPEFKTHQLDDRRGGIHVPVVDLNGDGKPDFVALIAQEHEEICAFINQGDFQFERKVLYNAENPSYGSSGIQLVDIDADGHTDVLYTNGDVLDSPHLLKPYHGVQWLRNLGTDDLEFEHRPIAPMYGVHRAVAADITGSGLLDVVAVSYLPQEHFPERAEHDADAIVVFEQTSPGQFVRHSLARTSCDHVTCVVGDLYGAGRNDLVTASFVLDGEAPSLLVFENEGPSSDDE